MKTQLLAIALLGSAATAQAPNAATANGVSAPPVKVQMGGDYGYPPYEYNDADGHPLGFDVDLMGALAQAIPLDVHIQFGPWSEEIQALADGKLDLLGMFYSEERAKRFDFSDPVVVVSHMIFVRDGSPRITSVRELAGLRVLVQSDAYAQDYLRRYQPDAHLFTADSEQEVLRRLSTAAPGEAYDAAILGQKAGNYLRQKLGVKNVHSTSPPVMPVNYCYAVKKGNQRLLTLLNRGLARIQAQGAYDRIYEHWFGAEDEDRVARMLHYARFTLGGLIIILLLGIAWTRSLKRQVRLKTQERTELIGRLSQALQARDTFFSVASHELRTPLTPLRAQIELVIRGLERLKTGDHSQVDKLLRYTRDTDHQLRRLTQLVNTLLDTATVTSGHLLTLKREECSLVTVAQEVIKRFENEIHNAGARVVLDAPLDPRGYWDLLRLEQVFTNLLTNALKYAPGGEIRIEMSVDGPLARFSFRDQGPGIPREKQDKIFTPFERGVSEQSVTGLGLGLFITRQIIRSHGGDIRLESEPLRGTAFIAELPLDARTSL